MTLVEGALIKRIVVAVFCVLMTTHAVRSGIVALSSEPAKGWAAVLWPTHPKVLGDAAMTGLEAATLQRKPLSSMDLARISTLAREDPLGTEPFLALGTDAYLNGHATQAQKLLLEARRRDPRVPAVRYFLAKVDIEEGRIGPALYEAAALARLVPGSTKYLAPAVSQLMRQAKGLDQVRQALKVFPDLAPTLLNELAADPANSDLLIAVARDLPGRLRRSQWQQTLVQGLLQRHEYQKAWFAWASLNRQRGGGELIRDREFSDGSTPPPFNWTFAEDGALVERGNDGLQVTYYGRRDVVLARQFLLLRPGSYELAMKYRRDIDDTMTFRSVITCLPSRLAVEELPHKDSLADAERVRFMIPSGCEAQELRLEAQPRDFARSSSFTVSDLQLTRQFDK